MSHDPRRIVEALRDHLSRHDKPIAFLLGAGASAAPRRVSASAPLIPPIAPLTALCAEAVSALGDDYQTAWNKIAAEALAAEGNELVEAVLSRVRLKVAAVGVNESMAGLSRDQLIAVQEEMQRTIASAVQPDEAEIPTELPHHSLARWLGRASRHRPIEIFTTNYDLLLERALEDQRIPVFDGFVGCFRPFFSPEALVHTEAAPASSWARLWKIHGSVNWRWLDVGGRRRIVRTEPSPSGELIFPSYEKYDQSRKQPYVAILDRLSRFLAQDDALVITAGYSFGDQHINDVMFDALGRPSRTHLVALQYVDPPNDGPLVAAARRRANVEALGPTGAWIGATWGEWHLAEPITNATASFMDIAFDSDAALDPDDVSRTGRFRLGDFDRFCRFLLTMGDVFMG